MGLVTGSNKIVIALSEQELTEMNSLAAEEDDLMRRGRIARDARLKLLEKVAQRAKKDPKDWQVDETGKFLMVS